IASVPPARTLVEPAPDIVPLVQVVVLPEAVLKPSAPFRVPWRTDVFTAGTNAEPRARVSVPLISCRRPVLEKVEPAPSVKLELRSEERRVGKEWGSGGEPQASIEKMPPATSTVPVLVSGRLEERVPVVVDVG